MSQLQYTRINMMIYFWNNLIDEAYKMIDLKSTKDDIKAAKDLEEIGKIMEMDNNTWSFCKAASELNQRLLKEYPVIQIMCDIANSMLPKSKSGTSDIGAILITDKFGILADVLIKHGIISNVKDFIKSVE